MVQMYNYITSKFVSQCGLTCNHNYVMPKVQLKLVLNWELRNIYHHHPESKKRKSSEANSGSIHPYGNAVKTSKTISTKCNSGLTSSSQKGPIRMSPTNWFINSPLSLWIRPFYCEKTDKSTTNRGPTWFTSQFVGDCESVPFL